MEFYANEGKQVCIDVEGNWYMRHAIHTHRIGVGEDYIDLVRRYVAPYRLTVKPVQLGNSPQVFIHRRTSSRSALIQPPLKNKKTPRL